MKRRAVLCLVGASLLAGPAQAASSSLRLFSRRTSRRPLLIAGSTSMAELSAALAEGFAKAHPDVDVVTEVGSSLSALIALRRDSIDVASMSRDLQDDEDEKGLRSYLVARTGIEVLVNRDSPVTSLTSQQVRAIMAGEITNWSQIGADNAPIQLFVGTPSRRLVEEEVLPGGTMAESARIFKYPGEAAEVVGGEPHGLGFVIHADKWNDDVRAVTVDGVDVSRETIFSERYPFTRSLYYAVEGEDPESTGPQFVDYVRSAAGRKIIERLNLIPTS